MQRPEVSVIVPTYCEAPNIRPLTERIAAALCDANLDGEIIVMDDRSPDGTADEARALSAEYPVRVIERSGPRSLGAAVIDGFEAAAGEILVVLDADLSHPPEAIPQLVRLVASGEADFAIGSRYVKQGATKGWPWLRRLNSTLATVLAAPLLRRRRVRDPMSGFFCLWRDTWLAADPLDVVGYKIGLELLVKAHCSRVAEVPIVFADRAAGRSKLTARERLRYLVHLKRLYEYRWPRATRIAVFGVIACFGLCVDLAVLNLAMLTGAVSFALARSLGALAACVAKFPLDQRLTSRGSGASGVAGRIGRYALSRGPGFIVNVALAALLYLHHPFFTAHFNAAAVVGFAAGSLVDLVLTGPQKAPAPAARL